MQFSAVCVYLLTLPDQLQQKWTMSAPYAARFCTIHHGTATRPLPPMWRNVVRPCSQNCGRKQHPDKHTADEAGDLFCTMPPPPPVSKHVQQSPTPKVCV